MEDDVMLVRLKGSGELHNAYRNTGSKLRWCGACGRPLEKWEYYTRHLRPHSHTRQPETYYACATCFKFERVGVDGTVLRDKEETQPMQAVGEEALEQRALLRRQKTEPIRVRFTELMERLGVHG